jgi:hypothetical protein
VRPRVHRAPMPELAPYVTDQETWRERRPLYAELFRKPGTFLFLARVRGEVVGYALGHVLGSAESWWSDTWRTGDRVGELESISRGFRPTWLYLSRFAGRDRAR